MRSQETDIPKFPGPEAGGQSPTPPGNSDPNFGQQPAPTMPTERKTRKRGPGQFSKGTSGNPAGRPPGSRNKATLMMEAMLEGEGEQLTRKLIDLASGGDIVALRLCLERLIPPRKDRSICLDLPRVENLPQISAAMSTVLEAIGDGRITPTEGETLANILTQQTNLVANLDLDRRVTELEQAISANKRDR